MYQRFEMIGNLAEDAVLRYAGDKPVLNFRAIASKKFKKADGTQVEKTVGVKAVLWGKLGEALAPYMKKGQQVFFSGEIETDSYEKDGATHYTWEINVDSDSFRLLGGKKSGNGNQQQSQQGQQSQPNGFDDPFADPVKF